MDDEGSGVEPIRVFNAVVLDASVLYPITLRDLLLRLAERGLYLPRWSALILEEVRRNLVADARSNEGQARRLIIEMRRHFLNADVDAPPELIERMTNARGDRHVLATAVMAGAEIIVTSNLKDFQPSALNALGIQAQSPEQFLQELLAAAPDTVIHTLREQAAALQNPPRSLADVLGALATQVPQFVTEVTNRLDAEEL